MATEQEFWGRPFEPGPVRDDPEGTAARARIVREALRRMETEQADMNVAAALDLLVLHASDDTLVQLARYLKA